MGAPKNQVGVFEARTPSDRNADRMIDRAQARYLVESKEAYWINRGRAIRMVRPSIRINCGSCECLPEAQACERRLDTIS